MGQAVTHDKRAVSAARYWASRPGNWRLGAVFDADDAYQEAALALWRYEREDPQQRITWGILYRRVLDVVEAFEPGYYAHAMPQMVPLDDAAEVSVACDAERLTLLHERLRILDALPDDKRQIVVHWLAGDDDEKAGREHGMTGAGWRWHRKRLFDSLQRRGL